MSQSDYLRRKRVANVLKLDAAEQPIMESSRLRDFKQFQFVSIVTNRYIIGLAIADIRYLSSSFLYVYDLENNTLIDNKWLRPLWFDRKSSKSPFSGLTEINNSNKAFSLLVEKPNNISASSLMR